MIWTASPISCTHDHSLPISNITFPGDSPTTTASGRITFPECMNDQEADDIEAQVSTESDTPDKAPIRELVRKKLVEEVKKKIMGFPEELIDCKCSFGSRVWIRVPSSNSFVLPSIPPPKSVNRKDVYIEKTDMTGHPVLAAHPHPPATPPPSKPPPPPQQSAIKGALTTVTQDLEFVCS